MLFQRVPNIFPTDHLSYFDLEFKGRRNGGLRLIKCYRLPPLFCLRGLSEGSIASFQVLY